MAPEHVSASVLRMLGKPPHSVYTAFAGRYNQMNQSCGMDQYLVPYLISSHPGCRMKDAVELAEYLRDIHHQPEQVQDFYPTPSTLSTVMYYTGVDPRTLKGEDLSSMKKVYVPRDPHEKAMQRALMQFRNPKLRPLVEEALIQAGRQTGSHSTGKSPRKTGVQTGSHSTGKSPRKTGVQTGSHSTGKSPRRTGVQTGSRPAGKRSHQSGARSETGRRHHS